jgi:dTDP-L-rhamnose 4-epimerase
MPESAQTVLVTGAAGFIGSHTVDLLVARGHRVIAIDILDPQVHGENATPRFLEQHIKSGSVEFHRGDVRDGNLMTSLIGRSDAVLHLAAAVGVGQSMYQPHHYMDVNVRGTALLMDILVNRDHRVKRVVVASSMSLYGEGAYQCGRCGPSFPTDREPRRLAANDWEPRCPKCDGTVEPIPTPEEKPLHCTSVYALSKKMQEELLILYGRAYAVPAIALRYFNVYGPRQSLNNPYTGVAAIFLSRLLNGARPVAFEDGRQSRDFVHVRDVARANVLALESTLPGQFVLNVGTGMATSILDVSRTLATGLGVDIQPEITARFRAGDIRHCIGNCGRIAEVLGFKAAISREEGFRELIEWSRGERPADTFGKTMEELKSRNLVS